MNASRASIVSCPNGGNIYSGRVIALRPSAKHSWVFLGTIGRRVESFDPARTRTSHPCIKEECPNHTEDSCLAGDYVNQLVRPGGGNAHNCSIDSTCRWRLEHGGRICHSCPGVNHPCMDAQPAGDVPGTANPPALENEAELGRSTKHPRP